MTYQSQFNYKFFGTIALTIGLVATIAAATITSTLPYLIPLLCGIVVYAILSNHPEYTIAIVTSGFYFYPMIFDAIGMSTSPSFTLGFWVTFSTVSLLGFLRHTWDNGFSRLNRFTLAVFFLFVLWQVIGWAVLSNFSESATRRVVFALFMMIIPFLCGQLTDREQLARTLRIMIVMGLLGGLIGIGRYLNGDFTSGGRYVVSESAGILIFAYAQCAASMLLFVYAQSRNDIKLWSLCFTYIGVAAFLIIATGSRGPLLAMGVCLLFLYIRRSKWSQWAALLVAVACVVVITPFVASYLPETALDRVLILVDWLRTSDLSGDTSLAEDATGNRSIVWRHSINVWLKQPWTGVGLAGLEGSSLGNFSHNFVIELLVEQGVVGILLFLAVVSRVASAFIRLYTKYLDDTLVLYVLVLTLFSLVNISLSGRLQAQPLFWWSIGVILALNFIAENESPVEEEVPLAELP